MPVGSTIRRGRQVVLPSAACLMVLVGAAERVCAADDGLGSSLISPIYQPSGELATIPLSSLSPTGGIPLWHTQHISGSPAGAAAFANGLGSESALAGAGGVSLGDLNLDGFHLGGYSAPHSQAALPDAVSVGWRWKSGTVSWGDGLLHLNDGQADGLNRSLQGLQVTTIAGPGQLSLIEGRGRVEVRHVVLAGAGSAGPYYLNNRGPILAQTIRVKVDGEEIPDKEWTLEPTAGALQFQNRLVGPLSSIDVRYEEQGEPSSRQDSLVAARYGASFSPGSAANFTWITRAAATPQSINDSEIAEGPFYGNGGPLTIYLSRSPAAALDQVTADGVPLSTPTDYLFYPAARLLYVHRLLPEGTLVEVHYRAGNGYAVSSRVNTASQFGVEGAIAMGNQSRLRLSMTGDDQGSAMDVAAGTRLLSQQLSLGIRYRQSASGFQAEPGLGNLWRQNGLDAGLKYQPARALQFSLAAVDANIPSGMPYLDAASPDQGPTVHLAGWRAQGSYSPAHLPGLKYLFEQYRQDGQPFGRQSVVMFSNGAHFMLSTQLSHTAAPGQNSQEEGGVAIGFRQGALLNIQANAGAERINSPLGNGTGAFTRVVANLTPVPTLTFSGAFQRQIRSSAAAWNQPFVPATAVAAQEFAPNYALDAEESQNEKSPVSAAAGTGSSMGPVFASVPVDPRQPGVFDVQAGSLFAPLSPSAISGIPWMALPTPLTPSLSQNWNFNLRWQAARSTAVELLQENGMASGDDFARQGENTTEVQVRFLPSLGGIPAGMILTQFSLQRTELMLASGDGANTANFGGSLALTVAPVSAWNVDARIARAAGIFDVLTVPNWRSQGFVAPGAQFVNSEAVQLRWLAAPNRTLSLGWERRQSESSSPFTTEVGSLGVIFRLPAGLGLELRGQHSALHAAVPLHFDGNSLAVSLVSFDAASRR